MDAKVIVRFQSLFRFAGYMKKQIFRKRGERVFFLDLGKKQNKLAYIEGFSTSLPNPYNVVDCAKKSPSQPLSVIPIPLLL